jgi:DNA-binding CsgD family transcriptional regulator
VNTPATPTEKDDRDYGRRVRLRDRRVEQKVLRELLDRVRAGMSGTLVLRGEPGIGKSALLEFAVESAPDLQVLRMVAVESEMAMGFAAVHHLLLPVLPAIDRLPEPQERALRVAFGLENGLPTDPFLVGLAVLSLLSDAAAARPVLCVIDDAQWLDDESVDIFSFTARRLLADRVGMLFAVCDTPGRPPHLQTLPELRMPGLPEEAATELLIATIGRPVPPAVGRHVVADTGGNPLALTEVARELTAQQLSGDAPLPQPLPLGRRLEERFARCIRDLPPETRRLLLLAAADQPACGHRLWRAASALGIPEPAAGPAEAAGLAVFWPEVRFQHPLVRAAVYHAATADQRRQAHRSLAGACDRDRDPDARAWHLAAAATGPDEHVAAEQEEAADRVRTRGGYATAAELLERAAVLSPSEEGQARRRLSAAHAELLAGALDRAGALLAQATPGIHDPLSRAMADRLDGTIRIARGQPSEAASILVRAARAFRARDPHEARACALSALDAALQAGWSASRPVLREIAETIEGLPEIDGFPASAADLLLRGYAARVTGGPASAVPALRRALAVFLADDAAADIGVHQLYLVILAATELYDDEALDALTQRWVRLARENGALVTLQYALLVRGMFADVPSGRLAAARAATEESRALAEAAGAPGVGGTRGQDVLLPLVFAGHEAEARAAADVLVREAREGHALGQVVFAAYSLGVLELSLGNYEAAAVWLGRVCENDGPLAASALPDLVEAAVRACRRDTAESALERLTERARASGTALALGLLARAQALLADHEAARGRYEEAIAQLRRSRSAPQLARAHLLYGEWLRRQRRRREARDQLRIAHDLFEAMGFDLFAERARVELRATGEHARHREAGAPEQLTPQEAQIAALVSRGETNREIAAQLFISPNTVEYHLRKVFRKLEVSSRTQLARRLIDDAPSIPGPRSPAHSARALGDRPG